MNGSSVQTLAIDQCVNCASLHKWIAYLPYLLDLTPRALGTLEGGVYSREVE